MSRTKALIHEVSVARQAYIASLSTIDDTQAQWKPSPDSWSAVDITEHLYWAEHGGLWGMWKTLYGIRAGQVTYEEKSLNDGLPIEAIIQLTWKEKELVPAVAAPRLGGTLPFWASALNSLQPVLADLGNDLQDHELALKAHPHPISGSLSYGQRFEFLRFHLDRHRGQIENLKKMYRQ